MEINVCHVPKLGHKIYYIDWNVSYVWMTSIDYCYFWQSNGLDSSPNEFISDMISLLEFMLDIIENPS